MKCILPKIEARLQIKESVINSVHHQGITLLVTHSIKLNKNYP